MRYCADGLCRLIKEGQMEAVKMEGGKRIKDAVKAVVSAGIPVVVHTTLLLTTYSYATPSHPHTLSRSPTLHLTLILTYSRSSPSPSLSHTLSPAHSYPHTLLLTHVAGTHWTHTTDCQCTWRVSSTGQDSSGSTAAARGCTRAAELWSQRYSHRISA